MFPLKPFFILSSLLFCATLWGQNSIVKQADKFFEEYAYSKAIALYKKHLEGDPKDFQAQYKLAECYRLTGNSKESEPHFQKSLSLVDQFPQIRFHYAQALMMNGKTSAAMAQYDRYTIEQPADSRGKRFVDWCSNIEKYKKDSSLYTIAPLPINSDGSEFGAFIVGDKLIFSSSRKDGLASKKDNWTGEGYIDLYQTTILDNGMTSEVVEKMPGKEKTKYHEGPASFTADGRTMFLTRNITKNDITKGNVMNLHIFEYRFNGQDWGTGKELFFGQKKNGASYGHAATSPDGKFLVFTSDMKDGYGGKDLYISYRQGDDWSEPKNLGSKINTEGDELFPYIHADGTLLFASDGLGGFGGLDIYQCELINRSWADPVNLGSAINSSKDDFSLTFNADKSKGYFASNRNNSKSGDDIFFLSLPIQQAPVLDQAPAVELVNSNKSKVNMPSPINKTGEGDKTTNEKPQTRLFLMGIVLNSKTFEPVENALVEIENIFNGVKKTQLTKTDGNFYFELEDGYEYKVRYLYQSRILDEITINTRTRPKGLKLLDGMLRGDPNSSYIATSPSPTPRATSPTLVTKGDEIIVDTFKTSSSNYGKSYYDVDTESTTIIFNSMKEHNLKPSKTKDLVPPSLPAPSTKKGEKGLVYKVQIGAFHRNLSDKSHFLNKVKGNYQLEKASNGMNRYIMGNFQDLSAGMEYLEYIKSLGYKDAFLAPYRDGKRLNIPAEEAR